MYELSVLKGYTFDCSADLIKILDPTSKTAKEAIQSKRKDEISIVNHVFVRNCSINRSENSCLSNFELNRLSLTAFDYRYDMKARSSSNNSLNVFEDGSLKKQSSIHILEELLRLKKLYQTSSSKKLAMTETTAESTSIEDKEE